MDDRFNVSMPPRQAGINSQGDADRVNRRPVQPRRPLYSLAAIAGSGESPAALPRTFTEALMEAAAELVPDQAIENERRSIQQLLSQTAVMNLLATAPNNLAALQPAVLSYATHIANQVNLEANAPIRFRPGDRFDDRDRTDGHTRVPPVNETRDSPEIV
ncbi:MAG: hypothetical protein FWH06_00970 [Oscillospiraceae bacterium]|nr:hypothetical protein [Oscillospiraceae bacterium]